MVYEVSLCVVTFNNEDRIQLVLNNLINILANKVTYQLFVVDNGSIDNTVSKIHQMQIKHKQIKLIERENLGFGTGHNTVIKLLNSRYHIVLNPDIEITSFEQLQSMILFLNQHKNVGLVSPLILNKDGTIQRLFKRQPTVFDLLIRFLSPNCFKKRQDWFVKINSGYNTVEKIDYASGAFMIFRTSLFEKIGGFDCRYFMYMEDADITRKVNGVSVAMFYPKAFVIHEWQRESHKKLKYTMYSIISLIKYFNKWGWKLY